MATIVRTMMVNWSIRRAAPKDAAALATCLDGGYAHYARRITDMPAISQGIEREIEDNLVWVGERDNEIIGGIILANKHDHGVVKNVAVGPGARGTGLGRALLDLAESEACRMGFAKLRAASL